MIEPAQASFYAREWSEDARFLIEEIKGYLIHLTMPLEFFDNCQMLMKRDNKTFDDLLVDAQFAYIILHDLGEQVSEYVLSEDAINYQLEYWQKISPFKGKYNCFELDIATSVDELNGLAMLLDFESIVSRKPYISIEELYLAFIDAYIKIDPKVLKQYINEAFEALETEEDE